MSELLPKAHPRREERYPYELPVILRAGRRDQLLTTVNVSYRGMFLRTDMPPALRQLMTVEATLPSTQLRFFSHAMAVFVHEPSKSGAASTSKLPAGIGVQFYAQSNSDRHNWIRFVNEIRGKQDRPVMATAIPNHHRLPASIIAELILRPETNAQLRRLCLDQIGKGSVEVCTELKAKVGDGVLLKVLHPDSDERLSIETEVSQVGGSGTPRLRLKVPPTTREGRQALLNFLGPDATFGPR
jgi:Tfp pilus assembly protein PilZ